KWPNQPPPYRAPRLVAKVFGVRQCPAAFGIRSTGGELKRNSPGNLGASESGEASPHSKTQARLWLRLSRHSHARRFRWNFERFDLLFDFVRETRRAGAVDYAMIERKRKGD